ncbi:sugar phosphate isomerase/epimerase family protein [uncultured Parasphingorhabdus sp.]|uniref:sugar phosphate isomerase/epimerase family protein n=1 Tax=uncultured Parasphingorhabdus sp. TaxID=2709694 RepID=UPI0030DC2904|tara:strand:+ start:6921 stop:7718 length:798 start_codon:yes stop_codon:yes gene_type:complete
MHRLALHQITMMEGGPEGLVRFAAEAGLDGVCLFTATPVNGQGHDMFPVVAPAASASFKRLLHDNDMRVINAEYFPVMAEQDVAAYAPAITLAAELGAKRIVTHIHETDCNRAQDQLSKLCAMARENGLEVGLEFTGFSAGCNSLSAAATLHGRVNEPNLGIAIDALHLFRTGGTPEQVEAVDPAIISYVQLCDGPDFRLSGEYFDEAMNRMIPGEGVFPLKKLVALLDPHVDIDIEVPDFAGSGGSDAKSWAHRAVTASRNLFA